MTLTKNILYIYIILDTKPKIISYNFNKKIDMDKIYIYTIISIIVLTIFVYLLHDNDKTLEKYSITLGMLAPQNKFYAKCTHDCVRDKTGDTSPGQFQWLCTDKCADIAKSRMKNGVDDLTSEEYQRHGGSSGGPHWNSEHVESEYCMNDIKSWCEERYCAFSNHSDCMEGCIKMKGVDCGGAVVGGWMP